MQVLRFRLCGTHAFFKKPDVNSYKYFTYGNIHKIALIGILGAIQGYGGYTNQYMNNDKSEAIKFPEFYQRLIRLRVGIAPRVDKGSFKKKFQQFNNSVGYASKEEGGNLIVTEEWINNPSWDIYLMLDCEEARDISDKIINNKCFFIPYLGKNDHPADIYDPTLLIAKEAENCKTIDSLAFEDKLVLDVDEMDDESDYFKFSEYYPNTLDPKTNLYRLSKMTLTNMPVKAYEDIIYDIDGKSITFI